MRRREFVRGASSLVAAATLMPSLLGAATADVIDSRTVDFSTGMSRDRFLALLNQTFYLHTQDGSVVVVQLVEIREPRGQLKPANLEQFSLVFRGPALPALPAGTYEVEHPLAGRALVYLDSGNADGLGVSYRADFCLLR